jgi:hypothetical protein
MKLFLSSTYEDLVLHREMVESSFAMSGIQYNAMEHFGSTPRPPLRTCLDSVEASEGFVGLLGVRYGGSPPNCVLSYTHREYRHAKSLGLPILMFLIDMRRAAVAPALIANESVDQQRRLQQFKEFVTKHHTVTFFTTPEHLGTLVLASLIREGWVI